MLQPWWYLFSGATSLSSVSKYKLTNSTPFSIRVLISLQVIPNLHCLCYRAESGVLKAHCTFLAFSFLIVHSRLQVHWKWSGAFVFFASLMISHNLQISDDNASKSALKSPWSFPWVPKLWRWVSCHQSPPTTSSYLSTTHPREHNQKFS